MEYKTIKKNHNLNSGSPKIIFLDTEEDIEDLSITNDNLDLPESKIYICKGYTKKGKSCSNKCSKNTDYCSLHKNLFKFTKPDDCLICTESLNNEYQPLSCGHWAHRKCVLKWKDICPVCREKIKLTKKEKDAIVNKYMNEYLDNINLRLLNIIEYSSSNNSSIDSSMDSSIGSSNHSVNDSVVPVEIQIDNNTLLLLTNILLNNQNIINSSNDTSSNDTTNNTTDNTSINTTNNNQRSNINTIENTIENTIGINQNLNIEEIILQQALDLIYNVQV